MFIRSFGVGSSRSYQTMLLFVLAFGVGTPVEKTNTTNIDIMVVVGVVVVVIVGGGGGCGR